MNRGIKVLQTSALPLGYGAILFLKENLYFTFFQVSKTVTTAYRSVLERITGLEPATSTLARSRSTK